MHDSPVIAQLESVSRTFGLTVGVLDDEKRHAVSLAYLLLRALDTCEDAHTVAPQQRRDALAAICAGLDDGRADPRPLAPVAAAAGAPERRLLHSLDPLLTEIHALPVAQREAITACAGVMAGGMADFLARRERGGGVLALTDPQDLLDYCYVVAGVVGEMLDRLYGPAGGDGEQQRLAVDMGTGLQLLNIVRDIRGDAAAGTSYDCWRDPAAAADGPSRPLLALAADRLVAGSRYLESISGGDASYLRFCYLNWRLSTGYLTRLLDGRRLRGRRYRARVFCHYHNSGVAVLSRRLLRGRIRALTTELQAALQRSATA